MLFRPLITVRDTESSDEVPGELDTTGVGLAAHCTVTVDIDLEQPLFRLCERDTIRHSQPGGSDLADNKSTLNLPCTYFYMTA